MIAAKMARTVHVVVIQIEGASSRLRSYADLIPEHIHANAPPPRHANADLHDAALQKNTTNRTFSLC